MRSALATIACVIFLLIAGGCVRSLNPVLEDQQVIAVPDLAGDWVSTEDPKGTAQFTPDGNAFKLSITDKDGKRGQFDARCGKVGPLTILEVAPAEMETKASDIWQAHLVPSYSFFVLTQTTPELRAKTIKAEWLKDYLAKNPAELRMAEKKGDEGLIAAPTAQLQQFIVKHWPDKEAWADEIVLVRSTKAATRP